MTDRRREIQDNYNKEHGITPKTIQKPLNPPIRMFQTKKTFDIDKEAKMTRNERITLIKEMEKEMKKAASELDFERATELRDIIFELKAEL